MNVHQLELRQVMIVGTGSEEPAVMRVLANVSIGMQHQLDVLQVSLLEKITRPMSITGHHDQ